MNQDEHQRERMRAWVHWAPTTNIEQVDWLLAEFDKRFPAPAAVEVAKAPALTTMSLDVAETILAQEAELASLRTKARLWDAVASGKLRLAATGTMPTAWWVDYNGKPGAYMAGTKNFPTAAEAVQAAIDAGALR